MSSDQHQQELLSKTTYATYPVYPTRPESHQLASSGLASDSGMVAIYMYVGLTYSPV